MAYNDRDWDRGNASDASWYPTDSRQNYHPREDDSYAQGKRRKFNDGVNALPSQPIQRSFFFQGYQGYDASQVYDESGYDARQGPQDYSQGQQGRGAGFPKKRLQPSEPSPHVIFLGLDPDFTESDVRISLDFPRIALQSLNPVLPLSSCNHSSTLTDAA